MQIAFFSDCYLDLTGGITTDINAQKAALEARGHTVEVYSTGYPRSTATLKQLAKHHIFLVPSCRWCFRGLTPVSHRPKIIENWLLRTHPELKNCDIFYVHYEAGCSIAALRLARQLGIPVVQVMHGREDMGLTNIIPFGFRTIVATSLCWLHARFIPHPIKIHRDHYLATTLAKAKMWELMINHANYASHVVTPSTHFLKKLQHYGLRCPSTVVPNCLADANFPPHAPIKDFAPGEPLRIIWHSRVSGEKRIMAFLEALRLLPQLVAERSPSYAPVNAAKSHRTSSKQPGSTSVNSLYHLDVYGGGGDLGRAQRYARRHHLSVTFHGTVPFDQLTATMRSAHLDVLVSSNFDTFGMTLIEAEAYSTPVLICDPDLTETLPPGTYLRSHNITPIAIARELDRLLTHPSLIHQMSANMHKNCSKIRASRRIKPLEQLFLHLSGPTKPQKPPKNS